MAKESKFVGGKTIRDVKIYNIETNEIIAEFDSLPASSLNGDGFLVRMEKKKEKRRME